MTEFDIKVVVVQYPDRKYLMARFVDPVTGKHKTRSTRTTTRREAERFAAKWEAELRAGRYRKPTKITWAEFRERYEDEKLAGLSPNTLQACTAAFNHLERVINPARLESLQATTLSQFQATLRGEGMEGTTIATYLRHLRAALSWAASLDLIGAVPKIAMPARARGRTLMRGRPLSDQEFQNLLAAVPQVRPDDSASWVYYLRGLWLSGLRLEESLALSWDEEASMLVDLSGRRPRLRIYSEADKGRRDRLLPMTPDFAQFLLETPEEKRNGLVFSLPGLQTGQPISPKRVSRIVSAMGEAAGIVVNKAAGKYASAHDLRRSFGTRWSRRVMPATLQLLMRHRSMETTLRYYVEQDADQVAEELWNLPAGAARPAV